MYIYIHIYMYIFIYINIHSHIYIHAYTYACICTIIVLSASIQFVGGSQYPSLLNETLLTHQNVTNSPINIAAHNILSMAQRDRTAQSCVCSVGRIGR